MEEYEEEVQARMYNEKIIGDRHYRPIQVVAARINWREIADQYRIKRGFSKVMRRLASRGYVSSWGKSGDVYSLTEFGAYYVRGRST